MAGNLHVPEVSAVGRMVISWQSADGKQCERVIEDPKEVERFLAFLRVHNDEWRKPWNTFPGGQYTVTLERDKELLLVLWMGSNWLGGREGSGGFSDNRLRSLSDTERAELLEILGIPKD